MRIEHPAQVLVSIPSEHVVTPCELFSKDRKVTAPRYFSLVKQGAKVGGKIGVISLLGISILMGAPYLKVIELAAYGLLGGMALGSYVKHSEYWTKKILPHLIDVKNQ